MGCKFVKTFLYLYALKRKKRFDGKNGKVYGKMGCRAGGGIVCRSMR